LGGGVRYYNGTRPVENISLHSVYDTTKCTRDGDMLTPYRFMLTQRSGRVRNVTPCSCGCVQSIPCGCASEGRKARCMRLVHLGRGTGSLLPPPALGLVFTPGPRIAVGIQ
jgi:hypothetical protein